MSKYFLASLYTGSSFGFDFGYVMNDYTAGSIAKFNMRLPYRSIMCTPWVITKSDTKRWAGFCSIVGVASMVATVSAVGYLGYHNAEQLCSKVLSMIFEGMDIPAQALSSTAIASTVLACVAAAWTSCIVMQNFVGAVIAAFVLEPKSPMYAVSEL